MTIPLFPSKLNIPSLPPTYLSRSRLDGLWSAASTKALVAVTAGAGFGKTSLLAAAARGGRPFLWYSLDESDAEGASFFAHMGEMLRRLGVAHGDGALSPDAILSQLVRSLEESRPGHVIVFDDVQCVAGAPRMLAFLERLARFLPERSTLVLSGREPLEIAEARLVSSGRATSITAAELRFTDEEVGRLLARRYPSSALDPRLARRIASATEGWAAGIEILLQAAGSPTPRAIERALELLRAAGSGWFGYFAEEVVSRLDACVQDFLLRSSVLPRLDPALCDRVLALERSAEILEDLRRRSLFTFALEERPPSYRYHRLFREFLCDRLARRGDPEAVRALRLRAAGALIEAEEWTDAAALFAEAGDAEATIQVIEERGDTLLDRGHYATLRRALESVPGPILSRRPAALAVLGQLQEIRGEWEEARATHRRALRAAPSARLRAQILSHLAKLEFRRGAYAPSEALCRKALRSLGSREREMRAAIQAQLGMAAAEQGRLDEAERDLEGALALYRKSGNDAGQGRVLLQLAANVHYFRGDLSKAKDGAREALVIFQRRKDLRRTAHALGVLGFLAMAEGDAPEARDLTDAAMRIVEALEYRMLEGYCHHTLGRCALLTGDLQGARGRFERSRRYGEELGEPALQTLPRLGLAEVDAAEGNLHSARALAGEALRRAQGRRDRFYAAQSCVLLGLIEHPSDPRAARALWDRAERILRSMHAGLELHRLLLVRFDAARPRGDAGSRLLAELVSGAARQEHAFLFLSLEPERSARVLAASLRHGIEIRWVSRLLVRLGPRSVQEVAPLLSADSERIRAAAIEILAQIGGAEAREALSQAGDPGSRTGRAALEAARDIESPHGPPLEIRALGALQVRCGDLALSLACWRSKRALGLFLLLLVHRFRWVPKDVVIESLWPEADPEKGANNLRQTVHLLRHELEPDLTGSRTSRFVRFRNDAYRLDPGERHSYDVVSFEGALAEGLRLLDSGQSAGESRLREACDLYRGGFLEETPYMEFAAAERERLRERFLRGLDKLLRLMSDRGSWNECASIARRGLAEDPLSEDLHWHLVHAHLKTGCRHEALAAYHKYERAVQVEFGVPPSARMRALAAAAAAVGGRPSGL